MKILVATDKFKDALDAPAAAAAITDGIIAALPTAQVLQMPLSDGGDGFASMISAYAGAKLITVGVTGPLQQAVKARYAWLPRQKRAYIEMAEAAGLHLVPAHLRSPLHTTTYGVGELIKHAMEQGATEISLGIGGSATHDLGTGMATALGYHFIDSVGRPFLPTGGSLLQIERISNSQVPKQLATLNIQVACDVTNPLTGPNGAAQIYALQKGATSAQLPLLESGSVHLAALIARDLGLKIEQIPGSGAGGGMGGGAIAFLKASLAPGAAMLLKLAGFEKKVNEADLVIAGEGKADGQSLQGKVLGEIARQSAIAGKPLLVLSGKLALTTEQLYKAKIWHAAALSPADEPLDKSLKLCKQRLIAATKQSLLFYLAEIKKPR